MKILCALFVAAVCLVPAGACAQRVTTDLPDGWKFIKQDVGVAAPVDGWESVMVPHTWNALDGQQGKEAHPDLKYGYYRGACWYQRTIEARPEWKGKRVFVRFEAASTVAQVYLNGRLLGEHRGGFTAFCFELTEQFRFDGPNDLRVRVDNSPVADVAPLSGDFNVEGGIYRPVHLIVTDPVCVSPLDSASPGVYLTPNYHEPPTASALDYGGEVDVKVVLSNGSAAAVRGRMMITVNDATGNWVSKSDYPDFAELQPGETKTFTFLEMIGHKVHEWNGRLDPYLYSITVDFLANGSEDEVSQSFGFRSVAITNEQGFLLNGKPYPIHGVNLHQDRRDKGWAMSAADHAEDMKLMLAMGVTAVRLAHYPQSECVHDLADRNGLLLWNEIPQVNEVKATREFAANARQQMREMILQRYNHPSAVFWGMFNELRQAKDDEVVPLLQGLKAEEKELDPGRLNVSASIVPVPKGAFMSVPDWMCFNTYFGWYYGTPGQLTKFTEDRYRADGHKRIGISEYGAGANPAQHEEEPLQKPKPGGPLHPEEWQTSIHEQAWAQIRDNPRVWGSFIWCMFDFASYVRDEGGHPGLNDKGLVTADRKTLKDAYFFYQANWTDAPMVHICGRRFTEHKVADVPVKVYSNAARVELKVNGKSLGVVAPDDLHICRWPTVRLQTGKNVIEAKVPGTGITDLCELSKVEK
jgi:beta-galactosidase